MTSAACSYCNKAARKFLLDFSIRLIAVISRGTEALMEAFPVISLQLYVLERQQRLCVQGEG